MANDGGLSLCSGHLVLCCQPFVPWTEAAFLTFSDFPDHSPCPGLRQLDVHVPHVLVVPGLQPSPDGQNVGYYRHSGVQPHPFQSHALMLVQQPGMLGAGEMAFYGGAFLIDILPLLGGTVEYTHNA